MVIDLRYGLPFVTATVQFAGRTATLGNAVLDTGSAGTVLALRAVTSLGIAPEPEEPTLTIRGVGGTESVIIRRLDALSLGELTAEPFEVEIGAMGYGFPIDAIVGMDFLTRVGAVLDLANLTVSAKVP